MTPWTILGMSAAASLAMTGYPRPGTVYFYAMTAGGMVVAQYVAPRHVGLAGAATAAWVMYYYNYAHPFGPGPTPLKSSKS